VTKQIFPVLLVELVVVKAFVGKREDGKRRTKQRYFAQLKHSVIFIALKFIAANNHGQSTYRELEFRSKGSEAE
jgi:hypothetical protein